MTLLQANVRVKAAVATTALPLEIQRSAVKQGKTRDQRSETQRMQALFNTEHGTSNWNA